MDTCLCLTTVTSTTVLGGVTRDLLGSKFLIERRDISFAELSVGSDDNCRSPWDDLNCFHLSFTFMQVRQRFLAS